MGFALVLNVFRQIRSIVSIALISVALLAAAGTRAGAWDLTLAWDANTEPELDGYTVYYSKNAPGPPYDFAWDLPLSDIANPAVPMVSLGALEEYVNYYFALTAYDTDGNESFFSRQLCVRADETIHECAPADAVSFDSSGGSGGGGGCYIQAAARRDRDVAPSAMPALLSSLAATFAFIFPALFARSADHN